MPSVSQECLLYRGRFSGRWSVMLCLLLGCRTTSSFDDLEEIASDDDPFKRSEKVHIDVPVRARILVVTECASDVATQGLPLRPWKRQVGQGPVLRVKGPAD